MSEKPDTKSVFAATKTRQVAAMIIALVSVLILALISKHPDLFFGIGKHWILRIQALIILLFVNFTAFNWKCPSCKRYLGHDMGRKTCKKCGAELQ